MTFERGYQIFVRTAYITGIAIIIVFLPFSKYILSIGMWTVAGAWILERVNLEKFVGFFTTGSWFKRILLGFPYTLGLWFISMGKGFKLFFRNKPAMVLASLYLLHMLGLLFTSDFGYAFKDLRTKAPMLILPLFMSTTKAFGKGDFYRFILLFVLNLVIVTLANTWNLIRFEFVDIRDISTHVSHIILGLMISMAIFYLGYFIFRKRLWSPWVKTVAAVLIVWFALYLLLSRSFTGIGVLLITFILLLVIYTFKSHRVWLKIGCIISMILVIAGSWFYVQSVVHDFYAEDPSELTNLDSVTPYGNPYVHAVDNRQTENGHYLWINIQWWELGEAWNERSSFPIDSLDRKGQPIKYTLLHYLTSKGLRKDRDGVYQLTGSEVEAVEKGISSVVHLEPFSLKGRIYEALTGYENYQHTGDPTGSSSMQRLEFWKASLGIIAENWLTGVGTGDMNEAFTRQYEAMDTKLDPDQWWRSHNQFLSIFIGFGVLGFIWFMVTLIYPPVAKQAFRDYFFLIFYIIAILSLITEDTLESQAGVSFFYFFFSFLLFAKREPDLL